jgi:ribonuclease VapC
MIVDTSALIAILRDEPEAQAFAVAIAETDLCRISAANYLEAAIVIDGSRNPVASRRFDDFLREAGIAIASVTEEQVKVAREAYRDFGRVSGHAAQLNFGDCFAYALAVTSGDRLLFKGEDFTHTGVAIYPS